MIIIYLKIASVPDNNTPYRLTNFDNDSQSTRQPSPPSETLLSMSPRIVKASPTLIDNRGKLQGKILNIIESESFLNIGDIKIPIPRLKFDWQKEKLDSFDQELFLIDTIYHDGIWKIENERNLKIEALENSVIEDVKMKIIEEKDTAIEQYIKELTSMKPMSSPKPPMRETQADNCTICQYNVVDEVKLSCRHTFCRVCMKNYVKLKIESCENSREPLEEFGISCPQCRRIYPYLEEFDEWLIDNGFSLTELWNLDSVDLDSGS